MTKPPTTNTDSPPRWGAYCLANDEALEWFQAFVRSFRKSNPSLPLTVIPYNSSISKLAALRTQFDFDLMEEASAARFDAIAPRVAGQNIAGGTFRKLNCFTGVFDPFFFFDSDIVVTMPLQRLMRAFEQTTYDLVYFDTDMMVFKPDFASEMMGKYDQFGFNSGAFITRKRAVDEAKILAAVSTGEAIRDQFACWGEQPFLNYLLQVSGCRMTHVNRLAPELTFKTKAWMPFKYDQEQKCFIDLERGCFPLIHWAGDEYPTMIRAEVFLQYRTLGMCETERARYRRGFYYRRFRRRLKSTMQKSPFFGRWLARRDDWLRQKHLRTATAK